MSQTVLGVLPGSCPTARTLLLMRQCAEGRSTICLQNETFSEAVGWFPQSTVELSTEQVGQLKALIGQSPSPRSQFTRGATSAEEFPATVSFVPGQAG